MVLAKEGASAFFFSVFWELFVFAVKGENARGFMLFFCIAGAIIYKNARGKENGDDTKGPCNAA